jgi:flagellar P-ring protein precursor FlgI
MSSRLTTRICLVLIAGIRALYAPSPSLFAQTRVADICRVKGQEENQLVGLGLVTGLRGTGDGGSYLPTVRALATAMQFLGNPTAKPPLELKDAKNVALVIVTATVPKDGGREGDRIDVNVSSIGKASSLSGGWLFLTALQDSRPGSNRVYAVADGKLKVEATSPTTARVYEGARLIEDFINPFVKEGKITLVMHRSHADARVSHAVAEAINGVFGLDRQYSRNSYVPYARAINPVNVEVTIPPQYRDDANNFLQQVLDLQVDEVKTEARVVINERTGAIVVTGDVQIGDAVVTHRNIVVETGLTKPGPFVSVGDTTRLQALLSALNAVQVPTEDVIEIVKNLERSGKLRGKLIIE